MAYLIKLGEPRPQHGARQGSTGPEKRPSGRAPRSPLAVAAVLVVLFTSVGSLGYRLRPPAGVATVSPSPASEVLDDTQDAAAVRVSATGEVLDDRQDSTWPR